MNEICEYSSGKNVPVFIHTGICGFERPEKFERWYAEYPKVLFILAHCRGAVIELFSKYANVYGDSSFCSPELLREIYDSGFASRIFWGTDFPITDFLYGRRTNSKETLTREYKELLKYPSLKT